MKHIDQLFCSSPASTAICSSMDPRAMIRPPGARSISGVGRESKRSGRRSPDVIPIDPIMTYNLNKSQRKRLITTPTGSSSSRYLLNESNRHRFFDHHSHHLIKTIDVHVPKPEEEIINSSPSTIRRTQVVVELMVSIHCKGCEGKVRKHISKMEGVTSFEIDLDLKKVTVVGEVTPLQVLTSISRVKTAQFWPSIPPFSVSPSPSIIIS